MGVPRALRTNPSTIRMRVNPVIIRSAPGRSASSVIETRISTGVESALPLIEMPDPAVGEQRERGHERAVLLRRFSSRLLRRSGVAGGQAERHVAGRALDEQGLVGGVHAQRRDRVLGRAHEDQLVAGAHQVQRPVRRERRRGDDADALVGPARLGAGGALEQPVDAVDHGQDDGEPDDRADDVRAGAADRRRAAAEAGAGRGDAGAEGRLVLVERGRLRLLGMARPPPGFSRRGGCASRRTRGPGGAARPACRSWRQGRCSSELGGVGERARRSPHRTARASA